MSQLVAAVNAERDDVCPTIRLTAYDLLVSTNRHTGGGDYDQLQKAFERLSGTRITTDIRTNGVRQREGFGIIDSWKIIEKNSADGRMMAIELRLSDWLYNAIMGREVLTLSREYFRLSRGFEADPAASGPCTDFAGRTGAGEWIEDQIARPGAGEHTELPLGLTN